MDQPGNGPLVDVQTANVKVTESSLSHRAQAIIALTPILTILVTAISGLGAFYLHTYEQRSISRARDDSEWRVALQKISLHEENAPIGAFEIQSFLGSPRHGRQARSIEAAILPAVLNVDEFDAAFFVLLTDTDANNQSDIISIASHLSNDIRNLHDEAIEKHCGHDGCPANIELKNFVLYPESYFHDDDQSARLGLANVKIAELESVTGGLADFWQGKGKKRKVSPQGDDLGGVIFYKGDFKGVDFTGAFLADAHFVGDCQVDRDEVLAQGALDECNVGK